METKTFFCDFKKREIKIISIKGVSVCPESLRCFGLDCSFLRDFNQNLGKRITFCDLGKLPKAS